MNQDASVLERSDVFGLSDVEGDLEDDDEKDETLSIELLRFGTYVITRQFFCNESYPLENPSKLLKEFGDEVKLFLRNCGRKGFIFMVKITLYLHNIFDYRRERHVMSTAQNAGFLHTFANNHVMVIVCVQFFKREDED